MECPNCNNYELEIKLLKEHKLIVNILFIAYEKMLVNDIKRYVKLMDEAKMIDDNTTFRDLIQYQKNTKKSIIDKVRDLFS